MRSDHDGGIVAPRVTNTVSEQAGSVVQVGSVYGHVEVATDRTGVVPAPRELPGDVTSFVGRDRQLEELDGLLAEAERAGDQSPAMVAVVSGTAGVGKTALVTRWAHKRGERFPDGQLYVNLRGFGPDEPLTAEQALAELLRSLGERSRHMPRGVDARAKWFRSIVASKQMLVVLDNAHSDEQVRPLLPGTPSCLVLVTSRGNLGGLVSRDGAKRISLSLLTRAEAIRLLRGLIGPRVERELAAANELVGHCGRLPLALRIAADLAVSNPDAPLAELVSELADEQHRLDLLNAGSDPQTAVRAVLSWSYRGLGDEEARVFRLLGLHSGRTFTKAGVEILADLEEFQAARILRALTQAHLIERVENHQFRMHDLLRVYASELALEEGEPA
jgi:hypothetical protein